MSSRQQVQTACLACRMRRAKCSGAQPCSRCEQRGATCEYKSCEWVSKSSLRAKIRRLQKRLGTLDSSHALDAGSSSSANENAMQSWIDGVQSPKLSSSGPFFAGYVRAFSSDSVSEGVPFGTLSILASTSTISSSCFDELLTWRSCHPTFQQRISSQYSSSLSTGAELSLPSAPLDAYSASTELDRWTEIGWTRAHVRHLFDVLVTWDSVSFCILRKKEFLQDYETGSSRFCSSALVHALLALATRLINETGNDSHVLPSGWLGSNYFLRKTDVLLQEQGSIDSLPDIQSLGILALYYIRCGQETEATKLAELCSARIQSLCGRESTRDLADEEYAKVRATTYCGAISVLRMLYLTTGVIFNESELSQGDFFNLDQLPYNAAGTSTMRPGAYSDSAICLQLANPQFLIIKLFQLTEWVYKVIVAQQKASELTQENVLTTYAKCLDWYRDLFELIGDGGSRSPFILLTHMYYHFCLLCVFRPFIGTEFQDTMIQPNEMCTQAVQSILSLAQSYDDLFTLRRVSALIPYFVCASGLFSLAIEDSESNIDSVPLSPQGAVSPQEPQPSCLNTTGFSPGTTSALQVKVSTVVHARILLSKMGESHPAAAMAAEKLKSLQIWRRPGGVKSD